MTPARIAVAIIVLHGATQSARAQSVDAETLFREGRDLVKQGNLSAGCPKLAASARIEASVGTLLNLGDCYERQGKLASAWAAFEKARSLAKQAAHDEKREREAARRAEHLEPQLATLTIHVGQRIDGLAIRRDGDPLDPALWNTAANVDPGSYTIIAEAPGHKRWQQTVVVASRAHQQITVPALEAEPAPVAAAPPPTVTAAPPATVVEPSPPPPPPAPPVVLHERATWSTTRDISVILGVGAAVAVGSGVYFGVHANDLQRQSDARCPSTSCADPTALRLNHEAKDSATRADVLYIAGGAGLALATVLWFTGRPDETTIVAPALGGGQYGAVLERRF